ncbi:MAG: DUF6102 family protein [Oscillospiraceae bacterium]|nr:DUF6102 family protein [Oscillospiraceae bacterium]
MNYILDSFVQSLIKSLDETYTLVLNIQFDLVFRTEDLITGIFFSNIAPTLYILGIALMIMMFLKKGFGVYVLWQDGDPDVEPSAYLLNFVKAIITASCFPYLFRLFVDICEEVLSLVMGDISEYALSDALLPNASGPFSLGILAFAIAYIILFFSLLMRGIELLILKVGVPLACVGLLDNDRGVFKAYFMQFVKLFLTTIIQLILAKLGSSIMFFQEGNLFNLSLGIACVILAVKTPKLMAEFLLPSSGGGSHRAMSVIYVANLAKGLLK